MDDKNVNGKSVETGKEKFHWRFWSLSFRLQHSKTAKIAIISNATPPNVPPTTGPTESLEWDWRPALAVVDESALDTVVRAVGLDDEADADVTPTGTTRK